jgi:SPP1 gp7 family putative phage head morphogenesis protein
MLTANQQLRRVNLYLASQQRGYRINQNRKRDPTGTVGIRAAYEQEMRRRFSRLITLIIKTIVDNDALSLVPDSPPEIPQFPIGTMRELRKNIDPGTPFEFTTDPQAKITAFINWLNRAIDDEILGVAIEGVPSIATGFTEANWMNSHILSAYNKGLADANAHLAAAGIIPGDLGLGVGFNLPIDTQTLNHLYSRQFELLKNTTTVMADGIRDVLTQGLAEGLNPVAIADTLSKTVNSIGIVRSVILARTEVIHTYAEASLNRYETYGTQGVVALVEFSNAGDERVCQQCIDLDGSKYLVKDARGIIPVHPQCRCAWLPIQNF